MTLPFSKETVHTEELCWGKYSENLSSGRGVYFFTIKDFKNAPFHVGTVSGSFKNRFRTHASNYSKGRYTFLREHYRIPCPEKSHREFINLWIKQESSDAFFVPSKAEPPDEIIRKESSVFWNDKISIWVACFPKSVDEIRLKKIESRLQYDLEHYTAIWSTLA